MTIDLILIYITTFVLINNIALQKKMHKQRKYFYETLNHDLKVAIIAQLRGLELLYHNEITDEIKKTCKYSLEMIDTLVNTYKYENHILTLNYENCYIKQIITKSAQYFTDIIKDKNIEISVDTTKMNHITCDTNEISKVIRYILDFTVNNCEKNKHIKINSYKNKNYQIIEIKYLGKSLTTEEQARMFEKNPRFSTVGHGIKMYFCKKIINIHNGTLEFKSYNGLNVFRISLPYNKPNFRQNNACNGKNLIFYPTINCRANSSVHSKQ